MAAGADPTKRKAYRVAPAPLAPRHVVHLRTAHDVRRLVRCGLCGGWGSRPAMLTNLDDAGLVGAFHGHCVVLTLPPDALLSLPAPELAKLRVSDTGIALMRRLLQLTG